MSITSPGFCMTGTSPPLRVGPIWRWSVDQYHAMVRSGVLDEEDPVELLDGFLVTKMPKNPSHSSSTAGTRDALAAVLPDGWRSTRSRQAQAKSPTTARSVSMARPRT